MSRTWDQDDQHPFGEQRGNPFPAPPLTALQSRYLQWWTKQGTLFNEGKLSLEQQKTTFDAIWNKSGQLCGRMNLFKESTSHINLDDPVKDGRPKWQALLDLQFNGSHRKAQAKYNLKETESLFTQIYGYDEKAARTKHGVQYVRFRFWKGVMELYFGIAKKTAWSRSNSDANSLSRSSKFVDPLSDADDPKGLPCLPMFVHDDPLVRSALELMSFWGFGGPLTLMNREIPRGSFAAYKFREGSKLTRDEVAGQSHLLPSKMSALSVVAFNKADVMQPWEELGLPLPSTVRHIKPSSDNDASRKQMTELACRLIALSPGTSEFCFVAEGNSFNELVRALAIEWEKGQADDKEKEQTDDKPFLRFYQNDSIKPLQTAAIAERAGSSSQRSAYQCIPKIEYGTMLVVPGRFVVTRVLQPSAAMLFADRREGIDGDQLALGRDAHLVRACLRGHVLLQEDKIPSSFAKLILSGLTFDVLKLPEQIDQLELVHSNARECPVVMCEHKGRGLIVNRFVYWNFYEVSHQFSTSYKVQPEDQLLLGEAVVTEYCFEDDAEKGPQIVWTLSKILEDGTTKVFRCYSQDLAPKLCPGAEAFILEQKPDLVDAVQRAASTPLDTKIELIKDGEKYQSALLWMYRNQTVAYAYLGIFQDGEVSHFRVPDVDQVEAPCMYRVFIEGKEGQSGFLRLWLAEKLHYPTTAHVRNGKMSKRVMHKFSKAVAFEKDLCREIGVLNPLSLALIAGAEYHVKVNKLKPTDFRLFPTSEHSYFGATVLLKQLGWSQPWSVSCPCTYEELVGGDTVDSDWHGINFGVIPIDFSKGAVYFVSEFLTDGKKVPDSLTLKLFASCNRVWLNTLKRHNKKQIKS